MRRAALALMITLPALASEPWTGPQIALESAYQGAMLADYFQTSSFHRSGFTVYTRTCTPGATWYTYTPQRMEVFESNPLLGHHPSQAAINQTFLAGAVGHLALSMVLPSHYRTAFQGVTLGAEVYMISRNACNAAIHLQF
jgi:hypothetical protein